MCRAETAEGENVCVYVHTHGHTGHVHQAHFSRETTCDRVMKDGVRRGGVSGWREEGEGRE